MPHGTHKSYEDETGQHRLGYVFNPTSRRHSVTQRVPGVEKKCAELNRTAAAEVFLAIYIPDDDHMHFLMTGNSMEESVDALNLQLSQAEQALRLQEHAQLHWNTMSEPEQKEITKKLQALSKRITFHHPSEYEECLHETQRIKQLNVPEQSNAVAGLKRRGKKSQTRDYVDMWLPREKINQLLRQNECQFNMLQTANGKPMSHKQKESFVKAPYSRQYAPPVQHAFPTLSRFITTRRAPVPTHTAYHVPSLQELEAQRALIQVNHEIDRKTNATTTAAPTASTDHFVHDYMSMYGMHSATPYVKTVTTEIKCDPVGPVPQTIRAHSYQRWQRSIDQLVLNEDVPLPVADTVPIKTEPETVPAPEPDELDSEHLNNYSSHSLLPNSVSATETIKASVDLIAPHKRKRPAALRAADHAMTAGKQTMATVDSVKRKKRKRRRHPPVPDTLPTDIPGVTAAEQQDALNSLFEDSKQEVRQYLQQQNTEPESVLHEFSRQLSREFNLFHSNLTVQLQQLTLVSLN